jgi:acyl-ACP thioesterase
VEVAEAAPGGRPIWPARSRRISWRYVPAGAPCRCRVREIVHNAWMEHLAPFVPPPEHGRTFTVARTVRSTDVTPQGRLRFDALARYLQDAAEDDVADAGLPGDYRWLLRRCEVTVRGYPVRGERLALCTFCSGTGPRWAGRVTTVGGHAGDLIQASAVWVAVEPSTGRPVPLGAAFGRVYGAAAGQRRVSAKLSHPAASPAAGRRAWPLRAADFDPAGHANNSVHWAAAEDVIAGLGWLPSRAEMEYHKPMLPGHQPELVTSGSSGEAGLWLLGGGRTLASARLAR